MYMHLEQILRPFSFHCKWVRDGDSPPWSVGPGAGQIMFYPGSVAINNSMEMLCSMGMCNLFGRAHMSVDN